MPAKSRNRLAVAMIVKNEAAAIDESLASVAAIADQIVVFDTSDDEQTQQAALAYQDSADHDMDWIRGSWTEDFAAARNACWSHINADWVLWLDAGETVAHAEAEALREFVLHEADTNIAYMMLVVSPPAEPGLDSEQVGRVRLMPVREDLRFEGRVRETVADSLFRAEMRLEGLPMRIHRGARENDPQRIEVRARRNLRLADMEVTARGPSPRMSNCIAAAYQDLGDVEQAAQAYARAIDSAVDGSTDKLEGYYGLLSTLDEIPQSGERQMQLCLQALEVFPVDSQLLCALGGYLQRQGRMDLAARSYETAFRFGQVNPEVSHVGRIREICAVCFGLSLQAQGQETDALKAFTHAVEQQPESESLARHLLNAFIRQGLRDDALGLADRLGVRENREALNSAIRGACLASQENWLPANAYLKTAFAAGSRDLICLRWYTVALMRQGKLAEAREVMQAWESVDPGNVELQSYRQLLDEPAHASPADSAAHNAKSTTGLPSGARLDSTAEAASESRRRRTRMSPHGIPAPPVAND